jgi:hypothetical protein
MCFWLHNIQHNNTYRKGLIIGDTQHKHHLVKHFSVIMLSVMLNVIILSVYAECRYAECNYVECLYTECRFHFCLRKRKAKSHFKIDRVNVKESI